VIVTVAIVGNDVDLTVVDHGIGFDAASERSSPSLGLRSMRDRARLVNGQLFVDSEMGAGTRIEVRIPIHDDR
jgi:signal transduction histidine kinase